jgi:hypothetical protein
MIKQCKEYNLNALERLCKEHQIDFSKISITNKDDNVIRSITYINGACSTEDCRGTFSRYFKEVYKYGGKCKRCILTDKYNLKNLKSLNIELTRKYYVDELHAGCIIEGKCLDCTNLFARKYCDLLHIGGYCYDCALKKGNKKYVDTCKSKYGVENISQLEEIKKQKEKTCTQNHGVPYATQSATIQIQIKKTSIKNWGTERPTQNKELLETIALRNEKHTGFRSPLMNPEIKQKITNTNIQKTGYSNPFSNPSVQTKIKKTLIEKFGVDNPMKNQECLKKAFKTGCRLKDYILPSGNTIQYMGYENYALDDLLTICKEEDINNDKLPVFDYIKNDGTKHTYLPDILIISQNKFIEVKSTYTITQDTDIIFLKQKAVKDAGYKCEIWVYNDNGEKIECYT